MGVRAQVGEASLRCRVVRRAAPFVPQRQGEDVLIAAVCSDQVTREGYHRLQAELERLMSTGRAEIARWLRDAREDGTEPGENAHLSEALEQQVLLERQIAALEHRLAMARIVEPAADGTAEIGARIHLCTPTGKARVYQLVGVREGDPSQRRVSIDSPIGQALLGRVAGDVVEVDAPKGRRRLEIVAIDAPARQAA
jgi:transcription elongation factor GreA